MATVQRYEMIQGRLIFKGTIKRPSKERPDPLIDHVMSNLHDSEEQKSVETTGLVTLRVPSDPNEPNGMRPLDINLNGHQYSLPRDVTATVPQEIAEVVLNAQAGKSTIVPAARGEKVICQIDPASGTYLPGKEPGEIENRRFNVVVEDMEG